MLISPTKALKIYKVSKPTIYADMKSGKLSFSKTEKGRRQIDIAELERLYPKRGIKEQSENQILEIEHKTFSNENSALLEKHIELLEIRLKEKNDEIASWKEAFDKAQSTADKITQLLEYKPQERDVKTTKEIDELKDQVDTLVKQNERVMELEERRAQERMEARRKARIALEKKKEEESRGLFKKIFGS